MLSQRLCKVSLFVMADLKSLEELNQKFLAWITEHFQAELTIES